MVHCAFKSRLTSHLPNLLTYLVVMMMMMMMMMFVIQQRVAMSLTSGTHN